MKHFSSNLGIINNQRLYSQGRSFCSCLLEWRWMKCCFFSYTEKIIAVLSAVHCNHFQNNNSCLSRPTSVSHKPARSRWPTVNLTLLGCATLSVRLHFLAPVRQHGCTDAVPNRTAIEWRGSIYLVVRYSNYSQPSSQVFMREKELPGFSRA